MIPETQPESAPQHLLQKWIGDLPYQLLLLEKVLLTDDFPFDYSPKSLDALEARLLQRYESAQVPEKRTEFVESAMAYLGEILLGIAGGAWGWNTRPVDDLPGQPVVWPDPELELSPVAPMLLISYALRVRTGTAFAEEIERLRQAVAARQHAVPGWEPVKEHTPRVDPSAPLPQDPVLTAWLAERRKALSVWAEDAFDGAWRWNFHPDTLDWLEVVVRRRFATVEEFDASRDEPFVQGACWYMGEVIRRNKGAVWQYIPFDPDAEPGAPGSRESVWTEVPFVDQPDKRVGGAAIPLGCLRELLLQEEVDGEPKERKDTLRDVLFWFRSSSYAHVGALLKRMGMVAREKVDSVLTKYVEFAHDELPPHEVPATLEAFGVAISAHGDDVDDLEESYAGILEEAAALTDGAVTITDVRLHGGEYGDVLEFARNGVLVTQHTEHMSDDYLDHLAITEFIDHVDPDPGDDIRRFYLVGFVRLRDANYESYFVFATPEQAAVLETGLGLELR
ncbi:hypothetical protein J7I98_34205 [Streptomyces sp. ISL-98]|uniref:hypothetical protein n=1 Tax=Streptomyces sp. ISL-98 TaxID=2819192 RepID=UPI001BE591E1|nr:hypothetical protein [Streptomyces sp. ISL-98]MBT2510789.1 hypothetical protein [Streptomyces sp. ISL-98]